jgi:CBS domain-containing protein
VDNLPGSEECSNCQLPLAPLDRPTAQNKVERSLMEDPVSALKPNAPVTLPPEAPVGAAIATMLDHNCGAILIVDAAGKLLGIFSERDLLTKVAGEHEPYAHLPISRFMTANPETVGAADTLAFALHKMDSGGYRHIPVVTGDKATGIISVRDMLRHITRLCKDH